MGTTQGFQWNEEKADANWQDHVSPLVKPFGGFETRWRSEHLDDREDYGQERIHIIAMCDGVVLNVTYTEGDDDIRLISARRAERYEQDHYYRENAG